MIRITIYYMYFWNIKRDMLKLKKTHMVRKIVCYQRIELKICLQIVNGNICVVYDHFTLINIQPMKFFVLITFFLCAA